MKPMTEENVKAAFAGESEAHMKYLAFAKQADREGYPNVARLFRAVASAEEKHAHYHLRMLGGVGSTESNLQEAFEGEDYEVEAMYPAFSAVAQLEGEEDADKGYYYAIEAEKNHRPLYGEAKSAVTADEDIDDTPIYVCGFCGHTGRGDAPEQCPICDNPRDGFEIF